jgi:phosphate/sulfate permease
LPWLPLPRRLRCERCTRFASLHLLGWARVAGSACIKMTPHCCHRRALVLQGIAAIVVSWFLSPIASGILAAIFYLVVRTTILRSKNSFQRAWYFLPILVGVCIFINGASPTLAIAAASAWGSRVVVVAAQPSVARLLSPTGSVNSCMTARSCCTCSHHAPPVAPPQHQPPARSVQRSACSIKA